jgi:hypothetical protein
MSKETKMVMVNEEVYNQLMRDSEFLSCLMAAGVDNWQNYGDAQAMMDDCEEM